MQLPLNFLYIIIKESYGGVLLDDFLDLLI